MSYENLTPKVKVFEIKSQISTVIYYRRSPLFKCLGQDVLRIADRYLPREAVRNAEIPASPKSGTLPALIEFAKIKLPLL